MPSPLVQFRLPQSDYDFLRSRNVDPNETARDRLQGWIRATRLREAQEALSKIPVRGTFDPVAAVHEARKDAGDRL